MRTEWIHCPVCGGKTRNKIREDTVLKNYPLYCPKCKQEVLVEAKNFHLCGWIFQLIALVSFDKGIIMPFDRMICSQENTYTIRIITL